MTKQFLTATFSNGSKITRTTDKGYGFAWRAFGAHANGKTGSESGFASTEDKAHKAANSVLRYFTHTPRGVEVVKVVATAPAKKVNPAKAAPFRIVQTTPGGKRFVIDTGGRHLRFAHRHEAVTKAAELKIENTAYCARSEYGVTCDYSVTDAKTIKR
jgi:hypothetical protein